MKRRDPGHGTIEELPSGRFRAKVWLSDGLRHSAGTHDTREDAEGVIAAMIEESRSTPTVELTVRHLVRRFEEQLELSRSYVAMANIRSIRKRWVETAKIADVPARSVRPPDVREWLDGLSSMSARFARQALTLLRRSYGWGVERGLVDSNPAREVRVGRRQAPTADPWTYLTPAEQSALLACPGMPAEWRDAVAFAIGSGLRAGEQWALRLEDLDVDGASPEVVVRYGSPRRAPKGRRIRRVPLFGLALAAARAQVERLRSSSRPNPNGLVFPSIEGGFRKVSRVPDWSSWLRAVGIDRRVRWHDLRHTCGASLISGWWGRRWTLEEVRDLLGHSEVRQTERYAHLGASAVKLAAAATPGPRGDHGGGQGGGTIRSALVPRHPPQNGLNNAGSLQRGPWPESTARAFLEAAAQGEDCGAFVEQFLEWAGASGHSLDRALELAGLIVAGAEADRGRRVG